MNHQFSYRKIDKQQKKALRELVRDEVAALENHLGSFDSDAVRLEGAIEKHGRKELYRVRLRLHLPGKSLAALEEADNAPGAIREAFAELRHQVDKFKHLARNDHLWKRPRRRAELREMLKGAGVPGDSEEQRKLYVELIQPHLPELFHFIRRELAYHQALGDLSPSDVRPEEVLDAAVVRGYGRFAERPEHLEVLPWLTGIALEVIGEEIEAHRVRERRVATEAPAPSDPMDVTDDEDTEIYEFYQPDEQIRMEDILPDPESPIPEEAEAIRERNLLVQEVLALLPRRWRHALVLMDVHDMKPEEVTEILGLDAAELDRLRGCAERFMREWLAQRLGPDEIEDATTLDLLGTPLREPLPEELEAEILEKFMPMA